MAGHAPQLDDLIALNREIASLIRAGIPLNVGLRGLSDGYGNRLTELSNRLADRLDQGQSLSAALDAEGPSISPVYSSVI